MISAANERGEDNQRSRRTHNQPSTHETITRIENPYYGEEEEAGNMACSKHRQVV